MRLAKYPLGAILAANLGMVALVIGLVAAGSFVFWRRPDDPAARTLLSLAGFAIGGSTEFPLGLQAIDLAGGRGVWTHVVGDIFNTLAWGSMLLFALVFPGPVAALRKRRWLVVAPYLFLVSLYGLWALSVSVRNLSALAELEALISVSAPAAKVTLPLMVLILASTYRRTADRGHRQALRIVLAGVVLSLVVYIFLGQLPDAVIGQPLIPWSFQPLALILPLLALIVSVLRYRLFEIDLILRRSLLFAAVFLSVVLVFLAAAWSGGQVLPRLRRAQDVSDEGLIIGAILVGGILAGALLPLARLLRRRLGKLAYGDRENPFLVVSELRSVDFSESTREVLQHTLNALSRTLRLSYAHIEIYEDTGAGQISVSLGETTRDATSVVLSHGGREFGRLMLDVPASREPLGPKDGHLLAEIGAQVGAVAQTVLMNAELRRSRSQIVQAREEERRRIRRDLHDGLGPSLAAQSMQLELARECLTTNPEVVDFMLGQLVEGTRVDILEIRRLVDDLRPAALDQLGLVSALRQLISRFDVDSPAQDAPASPRLRWQLHADEVEPLLAALEVAAYRIVAEATNNAVRHSGATQGMITIRRGDRDLTISVEDNGRGIRGGSARGLGLSSMRDRADEVGGTLKVSTAEGRGTKVLVRLPLAGEEADHD